MAGRPLNSLLKSFGINRAVFYGVLSKVWLAGTGFITIFLIASYFSPELQGYYFTFYSLLTLQVFVELGLGAVIINFASHEWAHLKLNQRGEIRGKDDSISRLKSLSRIAFLWYFAGGVLIALLLSIAGYIFFSNSNSVGINWVAPWIILCISTGLNMGVLPAFFLLEGCNQINNVYLYRFIQGILRTFATWVVIVMGGGLWAPVAATALPLLWAGFFLCNRYYNYFKSLAGPLTEQNLNWKKDIWPMQWRIAVSWLSGYFFFSLFTPVLFHYKGPVVAGQMGMTWSLINALSMMASLWIITRAPQFGMLVSKKEYPELDRLFYRVMIISFTVAILGAVAIFALILFIFSNGYPIALRLLRPLPTAFFLLATILMQISYAQSTYLRAHKKEPFMLLSVTSSAMMAAAVVVCGYLWGPLGIAIAYFSIIAFYGIPYGTLIWIRCKNEWH
ncbi:lipopolysaccharide biosynthesis protein [Candidatus Margulisiibacteriota bacterium]